jgi:prepilin-type processing-associated H-X9-DG protein
MCHTDEPLVNFDCKHWAFGGLIRRAGFTMVEPLTVVAVIMILVSLILPVSARAKRKAYEIECVSNMAQLDRLMRIESLGTGSEWFEFRNQMTWIVDYNAPSMPSICPAAPVRIEKGEPTFAWGSVNKAWEFPASEEALAPYESYESPPKGVERRNGSYALNGYVWRHPTIEGISSAPFFSADSDADHPSRLPLLADGTFPVGAVGNGDQPPRDLVAGSPGIGHFAVPRHGSVPAKIPRDHPPEKKLPGAINVVFFDGHIASVKLDDLWGLYWFKGYEPPLKRPGLK